MASGTISGLNNVSLIWENSNIGSSFASQTISLDLSKYGFIKVIFRSAYNYPERTFTFDIPVFLDNRTWGSTDVVRCGASSTYNGQAGGELLRRDVRPTVNGVYFGGGKRQLGTSETSNDAFCIPMKIWGIKGNPIDWE